jgi:hypothetical protein
MAVKTGRPRCRWVARTLAIAALALGVALVGVVIVRESGPPPELTAARVARSLMDATDSTGIILDDEGGCVQQPRGRWSCTVLDQGGSGMVVYAVTATSTSCWRARRAHVAGEGAPRTASACLH